MGLQGKDISEYVMKHNMLDKEESPMEMLMRLFRVCTWRDPDKMETPRRTVQIDQPSMMRQYTVLLAMSRERMVRSTLG